MRSRAQDAPAVEAINDVAQSFKDEALAPTSRHRGRGSSGKGVMSQYVFGLNVNFRNRFADLIKCYFDG